MTYPTVGFILVYSLVHINRHIFEEGIGLCQLLDYYFFLKVFLSEGIERGGNFGKYDERNVVLPVEKRMARGWYNMLHNVRYLWHYPSEVISIPFWKLWHYCWRKRKGYL